MRFFLLDVDSTASGLMIWSLLAAAIIVFGAGLNRLLHHWAASYRHAIWLATSICVLATPTVSYWVPGMLPRFSGETRIGAFQTTTSADLATSHAVPQSGNFRSESLQNDSHSAGTPEPAIAALNSAEFVIEKEPRATQKPLRAVSSPSVRPLLYKCLVSCWIAGVVIYLLRIWRARMELATAFRASNATCDEPLASLVKKLANEEGLNVALYPDCGSRGVSSSRITLTVSKSEVGPLVWGLMPARLLLPSSLSELPREAQEAAIRHEFAHVARGDEWVRRYLVILRTVFWFHPLVRYCCDQVQLFAEKACDDHVLRCGLKPSEYSRLLLKLGQKQSGVETAFAISGMAQSQIASRIRSILESSTSRRPMTRRGALAIAVAMLITTSAVSTLRPSASASGSSITPQDQAVSKSVGDQKLKVGPKDWPQWGGSSARNNTPVAQQVPLEWDITTGRNVRWSMSLGTQAYGGIVVANGKAFAGANNGSGYIKRFPKEIDLGVLLCFNEADGKFLWQHSNAKLATGRVHDWPDMGICSAPLVDGERLWYVTNRGEVVCLDTEGFRDGQNDGPYDQEPVIDENEADVVWVLDMMKLLGVSQHNMANCSVTCSGDMLFVNTSNGVDESHAKLPSEQAPSFICVSRATGGVLWTDNSPGKNILHGQWSSPAYAVLGDVPQVIFGGGDGYLYGFLAQGEDGNPKLLWKFDCNPKDAEYMLGGHSTRNHIVATPMIYDGLVYVAVGADPEHGEGNGHLWCIDPTKRGDVSPTLVFNTKSPDKPIAHKRRQALNAADGDFEMLNTNSAAVWHYVGKDPKVFDQAMHRSVSTVVIKNDLLFVPDFSGLFHCLDAKTGKVHWVYDLFASCWASPMIVGDRVYIGDEDGNVTVFKLSSKMELLQQVNLGTAVYSTPVVANDTLFLSSSNRLWALQEHAKSEPIKSK